jgi:hypothetical protein
VCFTSLQTPGKDMYEMDSTSAEEYSVCHQFTTLAERKKPVFCLNVYSVRVMNELFWS